MNYPSFFQNQNSNCQQPPQNGNMSQRQDAQPYQSNTQQVSPMMQTAQMPVACQSAPMPQNGFSTSSRIVASRDEAAVITADFSGALMVFPDIAHNRVYIKQWDSNAGSAVFSEYVPESLIVPQQPQQNALFASIQDIQNLRDMVDTLSKEIDRLKKPAGKAAKRNDANDE